MGVFDFFERIYSKKEEITEVKLEELTAWVDTFYKKRLKDIDLADIRKLVDEEKKRLEENIRRLDEAKLKNTEIPERYKQIMEGNRRVYLKEVTILLDEINLPEKPEEILEFYSIFNDALDNFAKTTVKSYHILQRFFIEEITSISTSIRAFDELMKKVKRLMENSKIEKLTELKNKAKELEQKTRQKEELLEKIKLAKSSLEEENKRVSEKDKKIKELKEGREYRKFIHLVNKQRSLKIEIEELRDKYLHSFSVIGSALKKYERLTLQEKLVIDYLSNPLKSLVKDKELEILELLKKMKESLLKAELELKEKKKNKILKELDKFSTDYLQTFLNSYSQLNKRLTEIKSEIGNVKVIKEIETLETEIKHDNLKIQENQQELNKILKKDINVENLSIALEKDIRDSTNQKVKLLYSG